jgi:ATP-dependent DNA helicase RecG
MPPIPAADLPFDALPLESATLDDLDLDLLGQTYLNQRSVPEQLAELGFATLDGTPTVAGMITLGREPSSFVPGAYVQFLRIDGDAWSEEILASRRIVGPLPDVCRELDELLVENAHADYPLAALQQLTSNALVHRAYDVSNAPVRVTWFSDRVEIQNPGGLYGNG